jgi:hypothetical protein
MISPLGGTPAGGGVGAAWGQEAQMMQILGRGMCVSSGCGLVVMVIFAVLGGGGRGFRFSPGDRGFRDRGR